MTILNNKNGLIFLVFEFYIWVNVMAALFCLAAFKTPANFNKNIFNLLNNHVETC